MYRQEPRAGTHRSRTRDRRFAGIRRLADAFVCGNDYLASFCHETGKPILVSPSPVPLDVPVAHRRKLGSSARIGWIGSRGNLASLRTLAPVFRRLAEKREFELVVISDASLDLPGVPIEHIPWSLATQERELARLDIGVMPLDETPWTLGKCAYKVQQYMAAALAVVASPVGVNAQLIADGENGLLSSGEREWLSALVRLVDDPGLAARLGAAGRKTVEEQHGFSHTARSWENFLATVLRRRFSDSP